MAFKDVPQLTTAAAFALIKRIRQCQASIKEAEDYAAIEIAENKRILAGLMREHEEALGAWTEANTTRGLGVNTPVGRIGFGKENAEIIVDEDALNQVLNDPHIHIESYWTTKTRTERNEAKIREHIETFGGLLDSDGCIIPIEGATVVRSRKLAVRAVAEPKAKATPSVAVEETEDE